MKGKFECRFVGGPQGDETLTLLGMYLADRVGLVSNVWIAEAPDGGATIMKGLRDKQARQR